MLKICCLFALIALAYAAPLDGEAQKAPTDVEMKSKDNEIVEIVESGSEHKLDGSYKFYFKGADGTYREETAVVVNPGTKDEYLSVTGEYSYIDLEGNDNIVKYRADNHGFVPVGNKIHEDISTSAKENSEHAMNQKDIVDGADEE